jgi:hypothetical protein
LLTVVAGAVAGLISWVGSESTLDRFKIDDEMVFPPDYKQISGYQKMAVQAMVEGAAREIVEKKKAAFSFGLLGLTLGLGLGLIGGLASGSIRKGLACAILGGLVGTSAGAVLSWGLVPIFFRHLDPEQGLLVLFLTHAGIFAGIGVTSGLALGVGMKDRSALGRAVFGGLLGALVGTFAFEAANSLLFPLIRTFEPVATEPVPRLDTQLCVAIGIGLIAGLAAGSSGRKPAAPRYEPT